MPEEHGEVEEEDTRIECDMCAGTGTVTRYDVPRAGLPQACPACKGNGRVENPDEGHE